MGKMSDEPLAREREPIERMRARLEALAAPTQLTLHWCGTSPSIRNERARSIAAAAAINGNRPVQS